MSTVLIPYIVDIAFFVGWAVTGLGSLYLGSVVAAFLVDRAFRNFSLTAAFLQFVIKRRKELQQSK